MAHRALVGLMALAVTAGMFGGTITIFEAQAPAAASQEIVVA